MKEMVGGCCVCSDDRGWPENPLVYCDGQSCTVAVHQACYGIVTVPTGPWYCRKCESQERTARVKCELCPSKYGALKRTDNSGWAHVVCALYIPEVRFGNVTTMEPIQLQLIPAERFNKVCYICEEQGKASSATVGACMQCNKTGCKQQFHVTCAQALGLLCEEAGNYLDNVKYCGYCQHHYSKLKKGGNVKTIPPYKPVSTENHLSDSNSEKEVDANTSVTNVKSSSSQSVSSGKRNKSSSSSKTSSSSKSSSSSKAISGSSHQKTVHNSSSKSEKDKVKISNSNVKSAKISDDSAPLNSAESVVEVKTEKSSTSDRSTPVIKEPKIESEVEIIKTEIKETKSSKKRKVNSRTSTPITVPTETVIPASNLSVVIPELSASVLSGISSGGSTIITSDKTSILVTENSDKIKKIKIEHIQPSSAPIVSLTASASVPTVVKNTPPPPPPPVPTDQAVIPAIASPNTNPSAVQTAAPQVNSLVVSVPLHNTNLSPRSNIVNQTNVVAAPAFPQLTQERNNIEVGSPNNLNNSLTTMTGGNNNQNTGVITSEMSGGGLKVTYEKQPTSSSSLRSELERGSGSAQVPVPIKRSRSMSGDKPEKVSRQKKRGVNATNAGQYNATTTHTNKRSSRSQHATPPPHSSTIIPVNQIKESPPSSPSSESQGPPTTSRGSSRGKGRKSAPASVSTSVVHMKDSKDNLKVFQNGVSAPHMLGNQLNPNSNMAQKMSDHLNSELEAHSIFNASEQSNLIGPQLHHRVLANARSSSTGGSSTASGGSGFSMLSGSGGSIPQTLDQLLERQWEQGSQFLMEQAQHFDIASLLSCLHQLRAENLRLEEHVSSLLQRRDHLLAVNARLAIPLTGQPATPQASHPHTVNNIHPSVVASHTEVPRSRHGGYSSHSQIPSQHASMPMENGLPPESGQIYPHHRSPANNQPQSSSTIRHSPAGSTGYPSSGLVRQSGDSGRTAPRPQPYPLYQGPGPSNAQSQMVIRREPEMHHQPSSKPS